MERCLSISRENFCDSFIPYVTSIIGEDIMAMHTLLINKPPDPEDYTVYTLAVTNVDLLSEQLLKYHMNGYF